MVMVQQSYNAKMSDFGLAKLGPSASQSHVTTRVMGTYGYAAPEYMQTGNHSLSLSHTLTLTVFQFLDILKFKLNLIPFVLLIIQGIYM